MGNELLSAQPYQLFPALSDEDYKSLKDSIAQHGVLIPVEKDEGGNILDGHHRVKAWKELRAQGIKLNPYVVLIRAGMTEEEKRKHIRTVNMQRRHLTKEERDDQIKAMREEGMSTRQIAEAVGVPRTTLMRAISGGPNGPPEQVTGKDGKQYPATIPHQPKTVVTTSGKQEQKIFEAVNKVGTDALPDKLIFDKRAQRVCREAETEQRRVELTTILQETTEVSKNGRYDIRHGRFQEKLSDIPDGTIDLIFTDPPYGAEFLPEWKDLAEYASRLLKPSGYLITYSGQTHLPKVFAMLSEKVHYVWTIALIHGSSKKNIVTHVKVYSQWKPILIFCKEPLSPIVGWVNDILNGERMEKDLHDWQQGLAEADFFIKTFSKPGDTVLDPFLGSGTTAVASLKLGRKIIGCDTDAACISKSLERINEQN